jgi:hypothetical protein
MSKELKLKNAKLETLEVNRVAFIGELKGFKQRLSYSITKDRYNDLLQIDPYKVYNIWHEGNIFRFIEQTKGAI